ncbi:hypothetical protein LX36DRAFT_482326 [Colletotrichum falcatum]|nr:hypothetical protein LX36DRAFT_482326 [Colletotrichum falcatum]
MLSPCLPVPSISRHLQRLWHETHVTLLSHRVHQVKSAYPPAYYLVPTTTPTKRHPSPQPPLIHPLLPCLGTFRPLTAKYTYLSCYPSSRQISLAAMLHDNADAGPGSPAGHGAS